MSNLLNNLNLKSRFIIVFSVVILLNLVNLFFTFNNLGILRKVGEKLYTQNFIGMNRLIEADRDAYQSRLAISESFHLTKRNNGEDIEKLQTEITSNLDQINTRYAEFYKLYKESVANANEELNSDVVSNYEKVKTLTSQINSLLKQQQFDQAESMYYSEYAPAFNVMREDMNKFTDLFLDATEKEQKNTAINGKRIFIAATIGFIITIAILIFSGYILNSSITRPLNVVVEATKEISEGKLDFNIKAEGNNEIAKVLISVDQMRQKLLDIISEISSASVSISSASNNLNLRSQRMSQAATEQASSVEELSSAMEEMASNIHQNADNSRQTEKIAIKASAEVKNGSSATSEAIELMKEIAGKISIINDIAFQTNILALNAAVEAARAGEYGRGFAVVAAEVRKLAERSKLAADEIQQLSVKVVGTSQQAGEKLESIVPEIENTTKLIQEITASSLEQNSGAEMINNTIQQMNQVTQQNATLAEDIASSSEELTEQARKLIAVTEYFKTERIS